MNHYRYRQFLQGCWKYSLAVLLGITVVAVAAYLADRPYVLNAQGDDTSIFLPMVLSGGENDPAAVGYDFSAVGEVAQRNRDDLAKALGSQDIGVSLADAATVRLSFAASGGTSGQTASQVDIRCSGADCAGGLVAAAARNGVEPLGASVPLDWRLLLHIDESRTLEIWQSAGSQLNMRLIRDGNSGPQVVFNCGVEGECLIEIDLSDVGSDVIETVTPSPTPISVSTPTPTATPTATPASGSGSVIFSNDFDQNTLGQYRESEWSADWWNPGWENGIEEGRVRIVSDSNGRALEVSYPEGEHGTRNTGAQWQLALGEDYEELYLSYRFKFGSGFDFVKGGKLPGLAGGAANTGCDRPTGRDGWSARMMWRADGKAIFYVYHPDQPTNTNCGENIEWTRNGAEVFFEDDRWYQVQHRVVMNRPGQRDGIIQGWLDGELLFDKQDVRFRDVDTFAIDMLYFSTFFGGGNSSFNTTRDERISFDDFVISRAPIDTSNPPPTPTATSTPAATPTATPDDTDPTEPTNTPTATPTPTATQVSGSAQTIFSHDFNQNSQGVYVESEWESDWLDASWNNGIDEGRARIVGGADVDGNALQVFYPQGSYGPSDSGVQWKLRLDRAYDEVTLTHRLKFEDGFDFVRGGKLYELTGEDAASGDEWDVSLQWRADGELRFKVEYPDQILNSAEVYPWLRNGAPLQLEGGRWYEVRQQVVMNTPGQSDGILRGWLDGELLFEKRTMRFRDVDTLAVDTFYVNTFFGGSGDSFAAAGDEYIYFDDFTISTE